MRKTKNMLSAVLASVMTLSLAACGGGTSEPGTTAAPADTTAAAETTTEAGSAAETTAAAAEETADTEPSKANTAAAAPLSIPLLEIRDFSIRVSPSYLSRYLNFIGFL